MRAPTSSRASVAENSRSFVIQKARGKKGKRARAGRACKKGGEKRIRAREVRACYARVKRSSFQRRAYIDRQDNPPSSSSSTLPPSLCPATDSPPASLHPSFPLYRYALEFFTIESRDIFLERGIFPGGRAFSACSSTRYVDFRT